MVKVTHSPLLCRTDMPHLMAETRLRHSARLARVGWGKGGGGGGGAWVFETAIIMAPSKGIHILQSNVRNHPALGLAWNRGSDSQYYKVNENEKHLAVKRLQTNTCILVLLTVIPCFFIFPCRRRDVECGC